MLPVTNRLVEIVDERDFDAISCLSCLTLSNGKRAKQPFFARFEKPAQWEKRTRCFCCDLNAAGRRTELTKPPRGEFLTNFAENKGSGPLKHCIQATENCAFFTENALVCLFLLPFERDRRWICCILCL